MRGRFLLTIILFVILPSFPLWAQPSRSGPPPAWFLADPEKDSVQGVSAEKAYQTVLVSQPSRTVLVAVLDTGVDIEHEDLKSVIWTNEKEIPGNGVDDDGNGYIDDVHGWNFLGGRNGTVSDDTYELTREYIRLEKKYGNLDEKKIPKSQRAGFQEYQKVKEKFEKLRNDNKEQYELYAGVYGNLKMSIDTLKAVLHLPSLTMAAVDSFKATTPTLSFAKGYTLSVIRRSGFEGDPEKLLEELKETVDYYGPIVKFGYNPSYDSRAIIGDNYEDLSERHYGNNDVRGADAEHGTHVAGIIAADRNNQLGIKGIADNVRIMPVRIVPPNGDERDKDVANAIRYAVDNGAQIINMSFGKGFSPEKKAVDDAVRYAEKKGVLIFHAAGNEGDDLDTEKNFPSRYYLDGTEARNWMEVGATSWGSNDQFVASFSNYGKKTVDFFAPGVDIYSTVPDNGYKDESGTSMACPTAVGVAAMLWSYFPDLSSIQVLDILRKSTRKFDGLTIDKPHGGKAKFSDLSRTGGLVNAYAALKMASEIKSRTVEN